MISRRLIRIKVLQALYGYYISNTKNINSYEKQLFFSIEKTYQLYHLLLLLIIEIKKYAQQRYEKAKNQILAFDYNYSFLPRFINNKLIEQLTINKQLNIYIEKKKISWFEHHSLIKKMFNNIEKSEFFLEYLHKEKNTYYDDKQIVIEIYKEIISCSVLLEQILEEECIFWNDEIEFVISMIIETIKGFNKHDNQDKPLKPLYKNNDDREFSRALFLKSIEYHEQHKELIDKFTKNWDINRIAVLDFLIMELALTELTQFPFIPVKVSLNEYIEISKYYSTEKSNYFINGVLDKIVKVLQKENKIVKKGPGLLNYSPENLD